MLKTQFANGEIYHIYNRGVEKRNVFSEDNDYLRFVHDLFEFNDSNPAPKFYIPSRPQLSEVSLPNREPREFLVEILVFVLMPNHFHLMVRQKIEGGVTEFMRKLGTGYTNYFNQKYERVGALFQGKFKSIRINNDSHFLHLPYYIHLNPLDLVAPEWRNREIKNYKQAARFLENYRWSSYLDYIGQKNFPSVTQREFLLKFYDGSDKYKKEMGSWLRNIGLEEVKAVTLE